MKLTIHDIIEQMKSDPMGVSIKFGIPLRTVYGWCNGTRKPPEYVLMMMLNILFLEGRLKINGNSEEGLAEGMEGDSGRIKETGKKSKSENGPS